MFTFFLFTQLLTRRAINYSCKTLIEFVLHSVKFESVNEEIDAEIEVGDEYNCQLIDSNRAFH